MPKKKGIRGQGGKNPDKPSTSPSNTDSDTETMVSNLAQMISQTKDIGDDDKSYGPLVDTIGDEGDDDDMESKPSTRSSDRETQRTEDTIEMGGPEYPSSIEGDTLSMELSILDDNEEENEWSSARTMSSTDKPYEEYISVGSLDGNTGAATTSSSGWHSSGAYIDAENPTLTPGGGPSGFKPPKKAVYGDNFAKPTTTDGPYGTGYRAPVVGDDSVPPPRTPLRERYRRWETETGSEEGSDNDSSDDPGENLPPVKGAPKSPSMTPKSPQLADPRMAPGRPIESPDEPEFPKKDKGKGKEPVVPDPKVPSKRNPIFENLPPGHLSELDEHGKIPAHVLNAPVMHRDDHRIFPRSPPLVFDLGSPIESPTERPGPTAEEEWKGKVAEEAGTGESSGLTTPTGNQKPFLGWAPVISSELGTEDKDTSPSIPFRDREAASSPGTGTEKLSPATEGKGLVMGRDDDVVRTKTPPPEINERIERERTQNEGPRKTRPGSVVSPSRPVTTPEITAWRNFTRKNPNEEYVALANSAIDSLASDQMSLLAENMKLVSLNEIYSNAYAEIEALNQGLLDNEQRLQEQWEAKVEAMQQEINEIRSEDPKNESQKPETGKEKDMNWLGESERYLKKLEAKVNELETERNAQHDRILELVEDLTAAREDTMPHSDGKAQLKNAQLKCEKEKTSLQTRIADLEGGDPFSPLAYNFDLPVYLDIDDQDLTGDINVEQFGPATHLTFDFAIMRCQSGINNIRVSRALRGYAAGDARAAIRAGRHAVEIARGLPNLAQRSGEKGTAYFWLGYALWYAYKHGEALNAFNKANELLLDNERVPPRLKNDIKVWVEELGKSQSRGPSKERLPYAELILKQFWQENLDNGDPVSK